jgi:sulfoxide reductase catalytic subunit YedY
MSIQHRSVPIKSTEITPEGLYLNRRQFLKALGILGAGAVLAACAPQVAAEPTAAAPTLAPVAAAAAQSDELGAAWTPLETIANYNNYYEFSTDKAAVARLAKGFPTSPWDVTVTGLVAKPQTFGLEDLLKRFTQEERIYRLRCVEAWSMVIPWQGFPLAALLKVVEPLSSAQYVRFETLSAPDEMPGLAEVFYPWPYTEGLRLDEAMHDLTLLATGLYGRPLTPQNGAPLRLAVPWKYGFKSSKAIVKIELVAEQPATFWNTIAPNEYGFYSNVNPQVSHPRWSQASERRLGELNRRPTLMFNGYAEEVASLYAGMDLQSNY